MNERCTRLSDQLNWLVDSDLSKEDKVEALMAEISVFMEGGPPQNEEEEVVAMEARFMVTLLYVGKTPLVVRYLKVLLKSWGE